MSTAPVTLCVGVSHVPCLQCKKPHLHYRSRAANAAWKNDPIFEQLLASEVAKASIAETLQTLAVWTRGVEEAKLADPCLVGAAKRLDITISNLSLMIAHHLRSQGAQSRVFFKKKATGQEEPSEHEEPAFDFPYCAHAVFVNGNLCTYLTLVREDKVALINIAALTCVKAPEEFQRMACLPIENELLEAAPSEPTLSVAEFRRLKDWTTITCDEPRLPRPWKHLIFVSHAWGSVSRPTTPIKEVQAEVDKYISRELGKPQTNPRMKAKDESDFGIWVDYMMVPNDPAHAECPRCQPEKTRMIQRINALLTLATVVPMSEHASERGWILQEMSLDKQGQTKFEHRDRVRLMANAVEFGTDILPDLDDGLLLRCAEFIRLALTPRVWPDVNRSLLETLLATNVEDEGGTEAWEALTQHARTFGMPCHALKSRMARDTQVLAGVVPGRTSSFKDPYDLGPLERAIAAQSESMRVLAKHIASDDLPSWAEGVHGAVRNEVDVARSRTPPRVAERLDRSLAIFTAGLADKLKDLPGPTDPEGALKGELGVEGRIALTETLQRQQFIAAAMGLRAEWLHWAGLASWVRLSVITDALGGTKFMARLKSGQVKFGDAGGITVAVDPRGVRDRFRFAKRIAAHGVLGEEAATLYELGSQG